MSTIYYEPIWDMPTLYRWWWDATIHLWASLCSRLCLLMKRCFSIPLRLVWFSLFSFLGSCLSFYVLYSSIEVLTSLSDDDDAYMLCYCLLSIVCYLLFILHSQWYKFSRARTRDLHSDYEDHERYDIEALVCFQLLYICSSFMPMFLLYSAPSTILASMLIRGVSSCSTTRCLLSGFVGINAPSSCSILTVTPPFQPLNCSTSWGAHTPYSLWEYGIGSPGVYGIHARLNIHMCQYAFLQINLLEGYVWYPVDRHSTVAYESTVTMYSGISSSLIPSLRSPYTAHT